VVWPQNHWNGFLRFGLKTGGDSFLQFDLKIDGDGFLVEPQNHDGGGFFGVGLKIDNYGLVIWVSKLPQQFLHLGLKTKQGTVYRLHHKINGRATVWDTHRDISACFAWKQVGLRFFSLPQDWWRRDDGWCTWHYHEGCVESKLKTDGSMRRAVSNPATFTLPFSVY
jgi:hypothetical protein